MIQKGVTIMVAGLNERELKQLAKAFTLLKDVDGSLAFLEDICTPNELKALSQRLEVAVRKLCKDRQRYGRQQHHGIPGKSLSELWSRWIPNPDPHFD